MGGVEGMGGLWKSGESCLFLGEKKRLQPRPASGINNPPIPPIPPTTEKASLREIQYYRGL